MRNERLRPNRIDDYFRAEWRVLAAVAVSGLIYNLGLLAGPWFEGKMAGCLANIFGGKSAYTDMLMLVAAYVLTIAIVQGARYMKRFYVRRFANNVNRRMKRVVYGNLVRKSRVALESEGAGSMLMKAIQDVDDCAEGMRKFTTEVFDTGVALLAYAGMLLSYDWRLALISMLFPPISFFLAEKMKRVVQKTGAAYKVEAGRLSGATLDRVANAITYRVFGCEKQRQGAYEKELGDYERAAVKANIWSSALPPLYRVISMAGILPIVWFGAQNIAGKGWTAWDLAAFTTFLSCFTKLATKSSSAAKLFNAVHKAQVSWKRICPTMQPVEALSEVSPLKPAVLEVRNVSFAYPDGEKILEDVNFTVQPGQIIGVTGSVACGKSTLGKLFLCEYPYEGSIRFDGKEISQMNRDERTGAFGYLGHDPELFSDSIQENVLLGSADDAEKYLRAVCLDREVAAMEDGIQTKVSSSGVRLSGGQAQRLALARTLKFKRPVLILDDPFSALDRNTEDAVFRALKAYAQDKIVLLISHRLYHFPKLSRIVYMEDGRAAVGAHEEMLKSSAGYRALYESQADQSGEQEAQ